VKITHYWFKTLQVNLKTTKSHCEIDNSVKMRIFVQLLLFTSFIIVAKGADTLSFVNTLDKCIKLDLFQNIRSSKLFKVALIANPALAAGFEIFNTIESLINPKEPIEVQLKRYLEEINKKLDEIQAAISGLKHAVKLASAINKIETKMEIFRGFIASVKGFESDIKIYHITFNDTSSPKLIGLLTKLIEQKFIEREIVDYFDISLGTTQSIVNEIIAYGQLRKDDYLTAVASSTAKIVQDFYFIVLKYILKSFAVRELAIDMKYFNTPNNENKTYDFSIVSEKKKEVLELFKESLGNASLLLRDDDLKAFVSLSRTGNDTSVRFKSVFQTFIATEESLSDNEACSKTCQDYTKVRFSSRGCYGQARDCWSDYNGNNLMSAKLRLQVPFKDRIYYEFNYGQVWKYSKFGSPMTAKYPHRDIYMVRYCFVM
jgi:hypothetical protein